jgi:hypothetical protein
MGSRDDQSRINAHGCVRKACLRARTKTGVASYLTARAPEGRNKFEDNPMNEEGGSRHENIKPTLPCGALTRPGTACQRPFVDTGGAI